MVYTSTYPCSVLVLKYKWCENQNELIPGSVVLVCTLEKFEAVCFVWLGELTSQKKKLLPINNQDKTSQKQMGQRKIFHFMSIILISFS